jgi:hypothetical protein
MEWMECKKSELKFSSFRTRRLNNNYDDDIKWMIVFEAHSKCVFLLSLEMNEHKQSMVIGISHSSRWYFFLQLLFYLHGIEEVLAIVVQFMHVRT